MLCRPEIRRERTAAERGESSNKLSVVAVDPLRDNGGRDRGEIAKGLKALAAVSRRDRDGESARGLKIPSAAAVTEPRCERPMPERGDHDENAPDARREAPGESCNGLNTSLRVLIVVRRDRVSGESCNELEEVRLDCAPAARRDGC